MRRAETVVRRMAAAQFGGGLGYHTADRLRCLGNITTSRAALVELSLRHSVELAIQLREFVLSLSVCL